MKKLLFLTSAVLLLNVSFATTNVTINPRLKASEIMIPLGSTGHKISLLAISEMSIKEAEALRGIKMNFTDRISFKAAQRLLKRNINYDGTFDGKRLIKHLKRGGETGFHFGGFALGFLLGPIGLLISYFINDDYKKNRVKWAWTGFAIFAALFTLLTRILLA